MATKKETTKTKEKKTTKSKSTKKEKGIKLTFSPITSNAKQFVMVLKTKKVELIDGEKISIDVPLVEGLPMEVIVRTGEELTVTDKQFKHLQELGFVESDESYKKRQEFISSIKEQHPKRPSWDAIANESDSRFYLTLRDSEQEVYNDKLIRL